MFRYNIFYVTNFEHNNGGMFYLTTLNQLFTGVYIIKLYVTGLFFLIRNNYNKVTCIN